MFKEEFGETWRGKTKSLTMQDGELYENFITFLE
jgi:hypothetical protein